MIDIESQVFTLIATKLRSKFKDITVASTLTDIPATFPFVSIVEGDNYTYVKSLDSSRREEHATVMYEINVYSNKSSGKKQECKNIYVTIDSELIKLGFTRISKSPFSNETATIYRIVGRYIAVVSKEGKIYRK